MAKERNAIWHWSRYLPDACYPFLTQTAALEQIERDIAALHARYAEFENDALREAAEDWSREEIESAIDKRNEDRIAAALAKAEGR